MGTSFRISRGQAEDVLAGSGTFTRAQAEAITAEQFADGAIMTVTPEGFRLDVPTGDLDPLGTFLAAARIALEQAQSEAPRYGGTFYAVARALEHLTDAERFASKDRATAVDRVAGLSLA
jgi:hypothetical protein